jgi:hypothetical protein
VEFIEAPLFTQSLSGYLEDDQYRRLQLFLTLDPEAGDVMRGTGGCRKLRWADRRRGKGKRGGLRVIYYYLVKDGQIWLLTLYDKDEVIDLSAREKSLLKAMVDREMQQRSGLNGPRGKV